MIASFGKNPYLKTYLVCKTENTLIISVVFIADFSKFLHKNGRFFDTFKNGDQFFYGTIISNILFFSLFSFFAQVYYFPIFYFLCFYQHYYINFSIQNLIL